MNTFLIIIFSCLFFSFTIPNALAVEQIFITESEDIDNVDFDGKWSFFREWKRSSLTSPFYDGYGVIHIRTAHQGDFIYVMINAPADINQNKGQDRAMICFDGNNDKSVTADENDFCFFVSLGGKTGPILQGGSQLDTSSNFKQFGFNENYISIASMSDENDRYLHIPHATYEFKIPIEIIGRSNIYGFYMSVYDHHNKNSYTWPQDIELKNYKEIPSPQLWGEIISPDKSLPEFHFVYVVIGLSIFSTILVTRIKKFPTL